MTPRVIAGQFGGRRLEAPRGRGTRPTGDRVREALFSILGDLGNARVLDLFAGSGALGLEALSRGAASATFVDTAQAAVNAVRANLATLDLDADVERRDALAFVRDASQKGRQYDLVLLDPPYRDAASLGAALAEALPPVLAPGARVASETDRRTPLPVPWPLSTERRYGDTLIRIHHLP